MKKISFSIILILSIFFFSFYGEDKELEELKNSKDSSLENESTKGTLMPRSPRPILPATEKTDETQLLKTGLGSRFNNSEDLFHLALELLGSAEKGNNEAQFYLGKAILDCLSLLDSGIIDDTAYNSVAALELHDWHRSRCAGFQNNDLVELGNMFDWFELSAKGKYPQALALRLIILDREQDITEIKQALHGNIGEVLTILGDLDRNGKRTVSKEALKILACDFDHDCSAISKEYWRLELASHCTSMMETSGKECDVGLDYIGYVKSRYTTAEFEQIKTKALFLKDMIELDKVNELTLEQILN